MKNYIPGDNEVGRQFLYLLKKKNRGEPLPPYNYIQEIDIEFYDFGPDLIAAVALQNGENYWYVFNRRYIYRKKEIPEVRRKADGGTWVGNGPKTDIHDRDGDGKELIGCRRFFEFWKGGVKTEWRKYEYEGNSPRTVAKTNNQMFEGWVVTMLFKTNDESSEPTNTKRKRSKVAERHTNVILDQQTQKGRENSTTISFPHDILQNFKPFEGQSSSTPGLINTVDHHTHTINLQNQNPNHHDVITVTSCDPQTTGHLMSILRSLQNLSNNLQVQMESTTVALDEPLPVNEPLNEAVNSILEDHGTIFDNLDDIKIPDLESWNPGNPTGNLGVSGDIILDEMQFPVADQQIQSAAGSSDEDFWKQLLADNSTTEEYEPLCAWYDR